MPNSLSLIYKMYHFYENNWTQVYNKTFLYKKYKIAFRLMQVSKKNSSKCLIHGRSPFKCTGI